MLIFESTSSVCRTLLVTILSLSRKAACLALLLPGMSEQSRAGEEQSLAAFIECRKMTSAEDLVFFFLLCAFLCAFLSFLADSWSASQQSTVEALAVPSVGGGGSDMSSLLVSSLLDDPSEMLSSDDDGNDSSSSLELSFNCCLCLVLLFCVLFLFCSVLCSGSSLLSLVSGVSQVMLETFWSCDGSFASTFLAPTPSFLSSFSASWI